MSGTEGTGPPSELLPREREAAEEIRIARQRAGDAFTITPRQLRDLFGMPPGQRAQYRPSPRDWSVIELALEQERLRPERPLRGLQLDEPVGLDLIEPAAVERLRGSRYWRLWTKTSKRVYWAIGVVLTLVAAYQLIVPDTPIRPKPMTGRTNIAVAPFSVAADAGDDVGQAAGVIAQSVYAGIVDQAEKSGAEAGLQIRGPGEIGSAGSDSRRLAEEIHASVVVSGRLAETPTLTTLTPSLYVPARVLPGATELAGLHSFGDPVVARGLASNPVVAGELARRVEARTRALVAFALGLSYFEAGRYSRAYARLAAAASDSAWSGHRPEILELALANAAIKQDRYGLASRHAARAQAIHPTSRAEFVAVESAFLRDKGRCEQGRINVGAVRRALDGYQRIELATQSARGGVEAILRTKAQFGTGRALFCLSQALVADRMTEARARFAQVVAAHADGVDGITEQAAEAEAALGLLAIPAEGDENAQAALQIAARHYRRAIALTGGDAVPPEPKSRQAVFRANLSTVYEQMGDRARARTELTRAVELEHDPLRRASYQRQLDELN